MAEWVPHTSCTNASGGCFTAGACLNSCIDYKQQDFEARIVAIQNRLLAIERHIAIQTGASHDAGVGRDDAR